MRLSEFRGCSANNVSWNIIVLAIIIIRPLVFILTVHVRIILRCQGHLLIGHAHGHHRNGIKAHPACGDSVQRQCRLVDSGEILLPFFEA